MQSRKRAPSLQGSPRGLCRAMQCGKASKGQHEPFCDSHKWRQESHQEGDWENFQGGFWEEPLWEREGFSEDQVRRSSVQCTSPESLRGIQGHLQESNSCKRDQEAAATKMFQFYANSLSSDAKDAWNKIVWEQTEADPYKDLKGMWKKGPRGLLRESFNDCVMFHLLAVFPNNTAEQEKYYLSNVLKKPQQVGIRQFVQRVEQINAYIAQLPCWCYSPSYVAGMTPPNVPFT